MYQSCFCTLQSINYEHGMEYLLACSEHVARGASPRWMTYYRLRLADGKAARSFNAVMIAPNYVRAHKRVSTT